VGVGFVGADVAVGFAAGADGNGSVPTDVVWTACVGDGAGVLVTVGWSATAVGFGVLAASVEPATGWP
jgi:hypothetical protein